MRADQAQAGFRPQNGVPTMKAMIDEPATHHVVTTLPPLASCQRSTSSRREKPAACRRASQLATACHGTGAGIDELEQVLGQGMASRLEWSWRHGLGKEVQAANATADIRFQAPAYPIS
jgi:hypothetical protein